MQNEIAQMRALAASALKSILAASPGQNGTFRLLVTTNIGDTPKPLLMVGNAHRHFEDAHGIAILNPEEGVLDEIRPGVAYSESLLKEIVGGRCDAMIDVWLVGGRLGRGYTYRARRKRPAAFVVK